MRTIMGILAGGTLVLAGVTAATGPVQATTYAHTHATQTQRAYFKYGVHLGTPAPDTARAVAAVKGDTYVAATSNHDAQDEDGQSAALLTKYDDRGHQIWQVARTAPDPHVNALGDGVVAGSYGVVLADERLYIGSGGRFLKEPFHIEHYSPAGAMLWDTDASQLGIPYYSWVHDVTVVGASVYVVGSSLTPDPRDPEDLDDRSYGQFVARLSLATGAPLGFRTTQFGNRLAWDHAAPLGDGVALVGHEDIGYGHHNQVVVRRIDARTLASVWTRTIAPVAGYTNDSGLVSYDNRLYVAGSTDGRLGGQRNHGHTDPFLVAYDGSGTRLWARQLGGGDDAGVVTADPDGPVLVRTQPGTSYLTTTIEMDGFAADGDPLWTRSLGSTDYGFALGAAWNYHGLRVLGGTHGATYGPAQDDEDLILADYRVSIGG